jgi:hypothetical protein
MTRLTAYRALRRALLSCSAAKKLVELGVQLFTLGDQFFRSGDLGVYFHLHHLLPPNNSIPLPALMVR